MNKPYTVLLLRPDYMANPFGHDTYLAHVEAASPDEALALARAEVSAADDNTFEKDYHCLFLTDRHVFDLSTGG